MLRYFASASAHADKWKCFVPRPLTFTCLYRAQRKTPYQEAMFDMRRGADCLQAF